VRALGVHRGAEVVRARHHVRDDLGVGRVRHGRLENADDGGGDRTEAEAPADHRGIAVERARPEAMRQDRRRRRPRAVVLGAQQAAEHGTQTHHGEERSADDAGAHDAWFTQADEREVDGGEITEGAKSWWRAP
jgi:hypothetical protein